MELKPLFGSIEKFDVDGIDGYATKLNALMDPDPRYDILRRSLLQPGRDAESTVASAIYALNESRARRGLHDGDAFEDVAHRLLQIDAISKTRSEDPPAGFVDDAFETYLRSLTTEGHSYYLAYDEVLAVAEAVRANVVVTRLEGGRYVVIGQHLGCPGDVAVVVMHGVRRGHFGRLCAVRELEQRAAAVVAARQAAAAAARRRAEEEEEEERRERGRARLREEARRRAVENEARRRERELSRQQEEEAMTAQRRRTTDGVSEQATKRRRSNGEDRSGEIDVSMQDILDGNGLAEESLSHSSMDDIVGRTSNAASAQQEGMEEGPVPISDILYDPSSNPMDDIIGCSAPEMQGAAAEGDAYSLSREEHNPMDDII